MKILVLFGFFSVVAAQAADEKTCAQAVLKINQMRERNLGSDGCNHFRGGYSAVSVLNENQKCQVEVSFVYGGTQVQCSGNSPLAEKILQARVTRNVRRLERICKRNGLAVVEDSEANRRYTHSIVCE